MNKTILLLIISMSTLWGGIEEKLIQRYSYGDDVITNIFIKSGILTIESSLRDGRMKKISFIERKPEVAKILEEALKKKYGALPLAYSVSLNEKKPVVTLFADQIEKETVAVFELSDDNSVFKEISEVKEKLKGRGLEE